MIQLRFISADGREQTVRARPGQSLMQAAVAADIDGVAADCGGTLTCATCHVLPDPTWQDHLPPPSRDEQSMLDFTATPRQAHSRLACQIMLNPALDGLVVRLPPSQY